MKKRITLIYLIVVVSSQLFAQNIDFDKPGTLGNLFIRMYGELHYYQPVGGETFSAGKFDAKRIVALFGYQFNRNTQFVTEWELEHANEIFLEQAFVKHKIAGKTSLKAGMILVPMGIINEQHEPNNYLSVDRPIVDRYLIPTTWRDIGIGVTGILPGDLKFQLYAVNGLLSYKSGTATFNRQSAYRSGRQKGIKTTMSGLPALSGQLEYFGYQSGKIGLSVYSGRSNTDAYNGTQRSDALAKKSADSTTVYTNMVGLHGSFSLGNLSIRSELIYSHNSGSQSYNAKVGSDLGKSSIGGYLEVGHPVSKDKKWIVFGRYGYLDNSLENALETSGDNIYNHIITAGINYMMAQGAVLKLDTQISNLNNDPTFFINSGVGIWF